MEGSPADRVKKILDQYPSPTFWDELFGPLRRYLTAKVRQNFWIFSEADALETADEAISRIHEHCDFDLLSRHQEDLRNSTFFRFVNTMLYNAAVDLIRQRSGRQTGRPNPIAGRVKLPPSELVWKAYNELSPADQIVITLKDIDGLTYEEMSSHYEEHFGQIVSKEALKKRRLRALHALNLRLKQLVSEGA
jgi:DNA-directed RNA polymerase specialized sigma24 family protein